MKKYVCDICNWKYDPEAGDPDNGKAGIAFENMLEDWVCLECGPDIDSLSEL